MVLKMDNFKKYYEVVVLVFFGGGNKKVVKVNEIFSFEVWEFEIFVIVGELGCGKLIFVKVLMGFEIVMDG